MSHKMPEKVEFKILIFEALENHITLGPRALEQEVRFHKQRAWRFDYAIPNLKLAFEYEGRGAGHLSWRSYSKDCEKYIWANMLGWVVVRITAKMVSDGRAGPLIRLAVDIRVDPSKRDPYDRYRGLPPCFVLPIALRDELEKPKNLDFCQQNKGSEEDELTGP